MTTIHILGAGVSGLAAAVELTQHGHDVTLYEAAKQAGGRCRSYHDDQLGSRIDNGNHLLLSGNWAVAKYLQVTGASEELVGPDLAEFPFVDAATGERWCVRPGAGRIPFWLLDKARRVLGASLTDYLKGFKLMRAAPEATLAELLDDGGALYHRFWEPLCLGVLNTHPKEAQGKLLWPVLAETFLKGETACRPRVAKRGLSETFVDPAIEYLETQGAGLKLGWRLRDVVRDEDRLTTLDFGEETVKLNQGDHVISALPAQVLKGLMPEISAPTDFRPIVNLHFKLDKALDNPPWLVGLTNATAQWIFVRGDVVSVTISAAESIVGEAADSIACKVWPEVRLALGLQQGTMPAVRVVKEKRATFSQTPEQVRLRSGPRTAFQNMTLSGDWTDNGLPATIEGSIRSGFKAAKIAAFAHAANP